MANENEQNSGDDTSPKYSIADVAEAMQALGGSKSAPVPPESARAESISDTADQALDDEKLSPEDEEALGREIQANLFGSEVKSSSPELSRAFARFDPKKRDEPQAAEYYHMRDEELESHGYF